MREFDHTLIISLIRKDRIQQIRPMQGAGGIPYAMKQYGCTFIARGSCHGACGVAVPYKPPIVTRGLMTVIPKPLHHRSNRDSRYLTGHSACNQTIWLYCF